MSRLIDLTGKRFGRLTVIKRLSEKNGSPTWLCLCDCGNMKVIGGNFLRNGTSTSCGCLVKIHGGTKSRLYHIWLGMKSRCYNPKNYRFDDYGNRGITVCDKWKYNFNAFSKWAKENGYRDDLSIDRIDNNGNYCPENCRWATPKEQANNRRNNLFITYKGERHTLSEWALILNMSFSTLAHRLYKNHWTVEKAFSTPPIIIKKIVEKREVI